MNIFQTSSLNSLEADANYLKEDAQDSNEAEDYAEFISEWKTMKLVPSKDSILASTCVWPYIKDPVCLQRFDIFEFSSLSLQKGSSNPLESQRIRKLYGWKNVLTFFCIDKSIDFTKQLHIYSSTLPKRHKFMLQEKKNSRDNSKWTLKETINVFIGTDRIPGTSNFYIDYQDNPDRYSINKDEEPSLGTRRLGQFAAYPATQYFILIKNIKYNIIKGINSIFQTCVIAKGTEVFAKKNWKLSGSFYGFDLQLPGSNKYSIYYRNDPFDRMLIALGPIEHAEEWILLCSFYAFDIPIPGTVPYIVQNLLRSTHSSAANIPRHRMTTETHDKLWEFRLSIYAFPATIEDCSVALITPMINDQ